MDNERSKILKNSAGIVKWMAILSEHFRVEISANNADIYRRALADLTPQELETACTEAIKTCRFMPTVADIRAHISKAANQLERNACDAEWSELIEKVEFYDSYYDRPGFNGWGYGGPPKLSEAGHAGVRACGGYDAIKATASHHRPLLRKTFDEAYQRYGSTQGALPANRQLTAGEGEKLIPMPDEFREKLKLIGKKM